MIKYIWIVMLVVLGILWLIYTIIDTIFVIDRYKPGYRFEHLEDISQCFYLAVPVTIFFYSLFNYLLL